jgi:23S rRNA (guanosine2251-2'-O)-methyltransferase
MTMDLIIGLHSIEAALLNDSRVKHELVGTSESLSELQKKTQIKIKELPFTVRTVAPHQLQEEAKRHYSDLGFTYSRVPSNIYLVADALEPYDLKWLYHRIDQGGARILCLDQVTDVHNAAAIFRSAAFFGVDAVLVSMKGSFGAGPSFHRLASGASEFIPIVKCSSLPSALTKLIDRGVLCVGLSEHASENFAEKVDGLKDSDCRCLILGAEDVGLSNAVARVLEHMMALVPKGPIKSLNVSVAAALAMSRLF